MTLVEKIKTLCDDRHTNFAALERALGFGGGSIRKWDKATPSGDRLAAVADHFDVSVDFLLGREKIPVILSDNGQRQVDEIFSQLSPDNRAKLLELALLYLSSQNKNGEKQ
jgi:hypothetical protein